MVKERLNRGLRFLEHLIVEISGETLESIKGLFPQSQVEFYVFIILVIALILRLFGLHVLNTFTHFAHSVCILILQTGQKRRNETLDFSCELLLGLIIHSQTLIEKQRPEFHGCQ